MSTTVLARGDGSSTTYLNTELGTILVGLESSNNSHVEGSGVAFRRLSAGRLLLHDVSTTLGRKLLEMFSVTWDNTEAFELKWTSSNVDMSTQQAVLAAGFSTTVNTLANIHANTYFVSGADQYLTSSNLVFNQGLFSTTPATLMALQATAPLTLTDDGSGVLTLAGASDPVYGSQIGGGIVLSWSNTNRLIFQSPLAAIANGTDTEVSVTIPAQATRFMPAMLEESS